MGFRSYDPEAYDLKMRSRKTRHRGDILLSMYVCCSPCAMDDDMLHDYRVLLSLHCFSPWGCAVGQRVGQKERSVNRKETGDREKDTKREKEVEVKT